MPSSLMSSLSAMFDTLLKQQQRLLTISTPLGDNRLFVQRVVGQEQLSTPFTFTVDCLSQEHDLDLCQLLAQSVTLSILQADGALRELNAIVSDAARLGSDGGISDYQLVLKPWIALLEHVTNSRIFQDMTAVEIIEKVLKAHPFSAGGSRFDLRHQDRYIKRSYCVQYRETDYHFVSRLLEEEGIWWYVAQEGTKHVVVFTDDNDTTPYVSPQRIKFHRQSSTEIADSLTDWGHRYRVQPTRVSLDTFDYKTPSSPPHAKADAVKTQGDLPELEQYDYPGEYAFHAPDRGRQLSETRLEHYEARAERFSGEGGVRQLGVGHGFELHEHPNHELGGADKRTFLLVKLTWWAENSLPISARRREMPGSLEVEVAALRERVGKTLERGAEQDTSNTAFFHVNLEAQPRKVTYRAPLHHVKPELGGPQTALVVGPKNEMIHTDDLNRVKVQFHWDRLGEFTERSSCWLRVAQANADGGWGAVFMPRVGQEVIVSFLEGDPDRPIITGRVYNGERNPLWHSNGLLSGFHTQNYRGQGHNELVFDDATNQSRVRLGTSLQTTELNLGYLIDQRENERGRFRGLGFELRSDAYGAIRANQGLYLSSWGQPQAGGHQLDVDPVQQQLTTAHALNRQLSDTAQQHKAESLSSLDPLQKAAEQASTALSNSTNGGGASAAQQASASGGTGNSKKMSAPWVHIASPAGISLTTPESTHIAQGNTLSLTSGKDTTVVTGKSLLATVTEKLSLFVHNAGIKLFAGKGKVELQAQSDEMALASKKDMTITSTNGKVEIASAKEILLRSGGAYIRLKNGSIEIHGPGNIDVKGAQHLFGGPAMMNRALPDLPGQSTLSQAAAPTPAARSAVPAEKSTPNKMASPTAKTADAKAKATSSATSSSSTSGSANAAKSAEASSGNKLAAPHQPPCPICPSPIAAQAPPSTTNNPIHLVMGDENLWQTDFVVPGRVELVWTRYYRSSCDLLDDSELGARWSTPYHQCIELSDDEMVLIDADNRMVSLAPLAVGESRFEPVEHLALAHPSEHELTCKTLYNEQQRFIRVDTNPVTGRARYRLAQYTEQDGRTLYFEYQHARLYRITDDGAMDVRLEYSEQGLVSQINRHYPNDEHPVDVLARYEHDAHRDLISHLDQRDNTRTYRYDQHLLTFYANRNGLGCHLEWTWPGKEEGLPAQADASRCIHNWLSDGSEDTRFEYHPQERLTQVIDAQGMVTNYRYNHQNRIESMTYPLRAELGGDYWRWDERGNLLAHFDGEGRTTTMAYDDAGRLTTITDPMSRTVAYEYNTIGVLTKTTDPTGRSEEIRYNAQGMVIEEIDFAGRSTHIAYNEQRLPITVTDPAENVYHYAWSEQGQLTSITDCSGQVTQFVHGHDGQLIQQIDALGHRVMFQRDRTGLVRVVRYPDDTVEQFEYDAEGGLVRYIDPQGSETRYVYDGKGLPVERIDAAGLRLAYSYDSLNRLKQLINQNGEQWTFEFDGTGRVVREVGFDGRTQDYTYDKGGMLLTRQEGEVTTHYEHDELGLLTCKRTEKEGLTPLDTHYAYDRLGRLTTIHNRSSEVTLHYDVNDNLIAEEQTADLPDQQHYRSVLRHTYDVLGNRLTTTLPNGREVAWLRYGSGHVHAMALDREPLLNFERDALHRETARHAGRQSQTRQYNRVGRLTRQQRLLGEHTQQERLYHYTKTSELSGISDSRKGESHYRYDPIGRLTAANTPLGKETFEFDPAGNLIDPEELKKVTKRRESRPVSTHWNGFSDEIEFDYTGLPNIMGNVLKRYAGTHYQHDSRGNRTRQIDPSGRTTEYYYNAEDLLIEVKRYRRTPAAGDNPAPEMRARYSYDGFGRRQWKLVQTGKRTPTLTVFAWDADLLISQEVFEGELGFQTAYAYPPAPELARELPEEPLSLPLAQRIHTLKANSRTRTHWLYEPDSFVPAVQLVELFEIHSQAPRTGLASLSTAATAAPEPQVHYIHTDHLGTPQELTDMDGQLHWSGQYKAWGGLQKATDGHGAEADVDMPLRFQGQYFDAETGLHYNRFRYYDPHVGRFTTQDPISLAGGINLYQYAPNPIGWVDPYGLTGKCGSENTVPYFRIQGGTGNKGASQTSRLRITPNEEQNGGITINGAQQLCVSTETPHHAIYYLGNNRQGGNVTVFDVTKSYHEELLANSVPQLMAAKESKKRKMNKQKAPNKLVDMKQSQPSKSLEIHSDWHEGLEKNASNMRNLSEKEFRQEFDSDGNVAEFIKKRDLKDKKSKYTKETDSQDVVDAKRAERAKKRVEKNDFFNDKKDK